MTMADITTSTAMSMDVEDIDSENEFPNIETPMIKTKKLYISVFFFVPKCNDKAINMLCNE